MSTQVFSPWAVVFTGAGVHVCVLLDIFLQLSELSLSRVLHAAYCKDVSTAKEALIDTFEHVDNFFKRLASRPTPKFHQRGNPSGGHHREEWSERPIKYALSRLDNLIQEEVRMATTQP